MKRIYLLFVFFSIITIGFSQDYKTDFYAAHKFLEEENYSKALEAFLELEKNHESNSNIKSIIGYCYLQSAFEQEKAVPFLEAVQEDLTADYRVGNHKEKQAPVEAIWHLGKAYHADYQFDKAIKAYTEYKDLLANANEEAKKQVTRDIRITRNAMDLIKNPVRVILHPLGKGMNTEYPDYRPLLNADETILMFTSRREGTVGGEKDEDGKYMEDIYYCEKVNGKWQDAKPVSDLNQKGHEASLYLAPTGQEMLVYAYDGGTDGTIYESKFDGMKWAEPTAMSAEINSDYWDSHASKSADGKTIAFVSDRPGGEGGRDIYLLKKLPSGEWSKVQNIGSTINTPYDEEGPYLHPDGKTLYFSSKGHKTMGGFDVFFSELQEDGSWSEPVNMGHPINTTGEDVFFVTSADGKRAYFSSLRDGGKGDQDIYMLEMPDLEAKNLAVYKGCVQDESGVVLTDVQINVYDKVSNDIVGEYRSNQKSGKFVFILNPGSYRIEYNHKGLIGSEELEVTLASRYSEISRLITKKGMELKVEETTLDCNGNKPANEQLTYRILLNEMPVKQSSVKVLKGNDIAYTEVTSNLGTFKYRPINPVGSETFDVDITNPGKCDELKVQLIDSRGEIVREIVQKVNCGEETVIENLDPIVFQKFYGYNKKGVETDEQRFGKFIKDAVAIYNKTGKITIVVEGSASKVPTRTFKTNKNLANKRYEEGKSSVEQALKTNQVDLSKVTITGAGKVHGPSYKGDFENGKEKYEKYQYIKITAK